MRGGEGLVAAAKEAIVSAIVYLIAHKRIGDATPLDARLVGALPSRMLVDHAIRHRQIARYQLDTITTKHIHAHTADVANDSMANHRITRVLQRDA